MSEELYKKYRPKTPSEFVGQKDAIQALKELGKNGGIPHTLLFTGPSGVGKTSIARMLAEKLKCSSYDLIEMNAANTRGIDDVKEIQHQVGASPLGGNCRIWIIDECGQLTAPAQDCFLKLLEDTPKHVYFFLATTDPQKLKKTIITRCTEIKCKAISESDLIGLVDRVAQAEGKPIKNAEVLSKIASVADGSARKALVILNSVIGYADPNEQLAAIAGSDPKGQSIELCRLLMSPKTAWKDIAAMLEKIDDEPETVRRIVLGYFKSVLLKGGAKRAHFIIEVMRDPLYDCGFPGLVANCYTINSDS